MSALSIDDASGRTFAGGRSVRTREICTVNVARIEMFGSAVWGLLDESGEVERPACLLLPELHDGPAEETAEERAAREDVAREVCAECPARALCLDYAVRVRPERGIWGGFTVEEIDALFPLLPLAEVA